MFFSQLSKAITVEYEEKGITGHFQDFIAFFYVCVPVK